MLFDEVRAGGRIPLIIGRGLTAKAREALGLPVSQLFRLPVSPADTKKGYSLAQKMVGRACGLPEGQGVRPGTYCEPKMTSVGSQDTTGPMTRDELKDLACLGFSADLVMQSFCHTAAYPKQVDIKTHHELPDFMSTRGGVSLRPGDGVIHCGSTACCCPTPSAPAATATRASRSASASRRFGPGRVCRRHRRDAARHARIGAGALQGQDAARHHAARPGARDSLYAIQQGLLTVAKKGKKNIFSGRILEIEGLPDLKVEQAFELSDARAERSAAGCTVKLNQAPIIEYLNSNVVLMRNMIAQG